MKTVLHDPMAERIWNEEAFQIKGKAKSKWLCYNMAMRARVFDDWTRQMLNQHADATNQDVHVLTGKCIKRYTAFMN